MGYYKKRKKLLEEKCWKLINLKPYIDDTGTVDNSQQKFVKRLQDITGEEGLKRAYEAKGG